MSKTPLRTCSHCRAEGRQVTLKRFEVGPTPDGHCSLCGSLYCQRCLRPFLSHDSSALETGLKIIGEAIYCTFPNCGAGHRFIIDGSGRVILDGTLLDRER